MATKKDENTTMTRTERNELRRIIKDRFALLNAQVAQRENEIAIKIRNEIVTENEKTMAEAAKAVIAVEKQLQTVIKKYREVVEDFDARGVVPESGYKHHTLSSLTLEQQFRPKNLERRVMERMAELKAGAGYQRLNLQQMELELSEELAIGSLESGEARAFLDRIPTVDTLLPLPNGTRQLETGR